MAAQECKLHDNSKFETNMGRYEQLPISVLKCPTYQEDGAVNYGVLICGDSVVDDLVKFVTGIKESWIIISTTQSHNIPVNVTPDLHLFSNQDGNEIYEKSEAGNIPYMNLGDGGHFINDEIFYPDKKVKKTIDAICVSKWSETKRVELFVQAAGKLPHRQFVLIGFLVSSERKRAKSIEYRERILKYINDNDIQNIQIVEPGDMVHKNNDGSVVPGSLTKDDMRLLYQSSKMTVLTAFDMEGINRSICEGLCCNIPSVITRDMIGGTPMLINDETGLLANPSGDSIAESIETILGMQGLEPRQAFLRVYGITNTNNRLKRRIRELALEKLISVDVEGIKDYGGDLWSYDFYKYVASEELLKKLKDLK